MAFLFRLDATSLIVWVMILGAVIGIGIFLFKTVFAGKKSQRIKTQVTQRRSELSRQQMESFNRGSSIRQRKASAYVGMAQKLLETFKMQNAQVSDNLKTTLAQAGYRGRNAVTLYLASRIVTAVGGAILTLVLLGLLKNFPYPEFVKFLFAAGGGVVGFFLPKIMLKNNMQKRQETMTLAFPDTLDLLLICVESGLSIELAFNRVTEEISESCPVLAQEIGLTSAELAYLGDRRKAYENFSKRTGLPAAKALATTLIQSEQYGTPVGKALGVLAQEKRDERMAAAERKAAALPAKLTVPMILFFLPVLFIVVIGPAALQFGN